PGRGIGRSLWRLSPRVGTVVRQRPRLLQRARALSRDLEGPQVPAADPRCDHVGRTLTIEDTEDTEKAFLNTGQRLMRLMPAFNTDLLKFNSRPRFKPVIRRYVSIWATKTGSNCRTLFTSTITLPSTIKSGR